MKLSFIIIPLVLLISLNACVDSTPTPIPTAVGTAVASTQTAAMWTPTNTPTPTHIPNEQQIVNWLNEPLRNADQISTGIDQLGQTIDAKYLFLDVEFQMEDGVTTIFRVDVRCECAINDQCCVPERMFVVTMIKMYPYRGQIAGEVPGTIREMSVLCYNSTVAFAEMSAPWQDVIGFLNGSINGWQFGFNVKRE
ncbi:MAG TPA: hypothetical protein VJ785_05505 [Anaerolineales bacterium]|nr:hypothetical protein [Anaerolineales bacterium]